MRLSINKAFSNAERVESCVHLSTLRCVCMLYIVITRQDVILTDVSATITIIWL